MKTGTAPDSITTWVCSDVPEAMLVRAHAASNYQHTRQVKDQHAAPPQSHELSPLVCLPEPLTDRFGGTRRSERRLRTR